jgi:hypothetical protein
LLLSGEDGFGASVLRFASGERDICGERDSCKSGDDYRLDRTSGGRVRRSKEHHGQPHRSSASASNDPPNLIYPHAVALRCTHPCVPRLLC